MATDVMSVVLISFSVTFLSYYTFWLFVSPYVLADENSRRLWGGMFPVDNYWAKVIPLYGLVLLMSLLGVFTGVVILKAKAAADSHNKKK